MWNYNEDYEKWILTEDTLLKSDFDYLKQELYTTRFYSKALSGSTYVDVDDVNNLFDTITNWRPRNWYISTSGSKYAVTNKPSDSAESIDLNSQYDFYTRNIKEYGLTLKNLFTPNRLIKDKLKSFINVDIATTTSIDLNNISNNYYIDGVRLINEHVVLVKDQITNITLSSTIDPDTYFKGPYRVVENKSTEIIYFYNNNQNGLYKYLDGELIKMNDLDNYEMCSNLSIFVKSGILNSNKQFHLKRLLNGYYPTSFLSDPMEFEEKHNWILRNRVDYNNLFETNYYDMIKHGTQSLFSNGITYSIPERLLTVGEFGVIVNNQYGLSTIIPNKWKSNLRSITHTKLYYWICGDDNTFLKINKTDFSISSIKLEGYNSYKCVSFNESFGVIVGDYNVLFYTDNGGGTWNRLKFEYFNSYSFNKVLIKNSNKFYVTGRGGIFLEFSKDINGWNSYKREISKKVDDDDENVLVDHINDIIFCNVSNWGLSYSYSTQSISSNKDILVMVTDDNKFIIYDENNFVTPDFLYLDFNYNYGNIKNISQQTGTSSFFFSNDNGVYKFDLNDFKYLGIGNTYSNTAKVTNSPVLIFDKYVNKVYNNGNYLYLSGNYSLIKSSTHSLTYSFSDIDNSFSSKLHSKLLFMDYDMGSKLNFFTDEGEYRLPNSITLPDSYFLNIGSVLSFDGIKYIGLDNKEIIEKSWIDYWVDRQKTFEYYSESQDMVLMNRKFSFNANISATVSSVSNKEINLMPLINSKGVTSTRYYRNVDDPVIKDPSKMDTQNQLYLSGYLMVLVLGDPNSMNVKIGDVIRMESNVIDGNFIVNKILITDKNSKCVYMYSEFNNNIITNLTKIPNNIKFTNLNIFKDRDSFISNFNSHPFGIAYKATYSSGVKITPQFNNLTSYYNLGIYVNGISSGLNQFKQDNINYKILLNSGIPKTIYCPSNIEKITEVQVSIKILDSGKTSNNFIINLIGPNGKIINLHNGIIKNTNDSQVFKFSSISTTEFPVKGVGLIGGLYKMKYSLNVGGVYKSDETNISNLLFNNSSKGEWKLVVINVATNLKNYLVDWDINFKGIIKEEMKYPDTFMKFGYTPMYNLLDYLSGINPINSKPIFHPEKEYLSLPVYNDIILYSLDSILNINDSDNYIYIKGSIKTNKLYFGFNLKFEWESIFLNTFVDINIYQPDGDINSLSRKLLVLKKYYDTEKRLYVIEFHNYIKFDSTKAFGGTTVIDITSRRRLSQISEDLQELNNIQRPMSKVSSTSNLSFTSYDSFLNFKIPTDSYTKVLLSDVETVKNLTGIIYTDYKNEIAFNITKLDKNYKVPIQNTIDQNGSLYIQCFEKHELSDGDGVMLEFNGGEFSSEYLNQQYFGYQVVDKIFNDYGFTVKLNYGNNVYVGNDAGYVKYVKKDPFFNYQPVDLIDLTDDKKIKQSIQIDPSNIQITGSTWSLIDLDYTKLRFRLVDGLSFEDLTSSYSWLLEAEISDAVIGLDSGGVVWYKGIWEFGRWFGGTWYSGTWNYGDWYGGKWNSSRIIDNNMSISIDKKAVSPEYSIWKTGRWYDGTWNNGTWQNGRWYAGSWNNGLWNNGIWNNGTWNNGYFRGGIWVDGIWNNGYFNTDNEPAYWLDGEWNSGDFENGMWYDGSFNQAFDGVSRFGTKSSNSRTSVWHSGNFKGGSFYSRIGTSLVSDVHKYSIWRTGNWLSGSWYGGIAYNIKFSSGSWYGGILEDIQIIGINSDNSFILNGVFRFNIGDVISITGDVNGKFAEFGNNDNPKKYKITDCEIDELNKITKIYVDYNIDLTNYNGFKSEIYDFNLISSGDYKLGTVKLNDYGVKISDLNIKIDLEITNNISNNSFYGVLGVTLPGSTFTDITFDGNVSNVYIVGTILYFSAETSSGSKITLSGPVTSSLYSGGKTVVKISSLQTTKIIQTTSKIFVTTGKFLNNILINLQSSNGNIINIKDVNSGLNSIYLRNSKFSTSSTNDIVSALNPVYEDVYKFQSSSNVGTNGYVSNITTKSDLFKDLKDDFWTIYIKSYNSTSFKINSLKMEISISDEIGAQLNKPISNGFDTGLRIVSEFNNSNWKSGIWSNGIFNGGLYEGGVWYDGIFNGKWI